jgi:hypothetical protein
VKLIERNILVAFIRRSLKISSFQGILLQRVCSKFNFQPSIIIKSPRVVFVSVPRSATFCISHYIPDACSPISFALVSHCEWMGIRCVFVCLGHCAAAAVHSAGWRRDSVMQCNCAPHGIARVHPIFFFMLEGFARFQPSFCAARLLWLLVFSAELYARYARARQKPRVSLLIARTESVIAHVLHSLSRVKVIFLVNSLSPRRSALWDAVSLLLDNTQQTHSPSRRVWMIIIYAAF